MLRAGQHNVVAVSAHVAHGEQFPVSQKRCSFRQPQKGARHCISTVIVDDHIAVTHRRCVTAQQIHRQRSPRQRHRSRDIHLVVAGSRRGALHFNQQIRAAAQIKVAGVQNARTVARLHTAIRQKHRADLAITFQDGAVSQINRPADTGVRIRDERARFQMQGAFRMQGAQPCCCRFQKLITVTERVQLLGRNSHGSIGRPDGGVRGIHPGMQRHAVAGHFHSGTTQNVPVSGQLNLRPDTGRHVRIAGQLQRAVDGNRHIRSAAKSQFARL